MLVDEYLRRIGIEQRPAADLAGLRAVHRAHIMAIPYENLDVQLGRSMTTSVAGSWNKIVEGRRGGWCYEMNGLLGYALSELGFKTTRLAGAVMRESRGHLSLSNHLVIKVDLEGDVYLADVGFGEGSFDPVLFTPGEFHSNGFKFSLSKEDDKWWRMHKYLPNGRRSFDFTLDPADEACFAAQCVALQTESDSMFVQNLICYLHFEGGYINLRGRELRKVESTANIERMEVSERLIEDAEDLVSTLKNDFGLDLPEAAGIWPKVVARHVEVMNEKM